MPNLLTNLELVELSLVDRPANAQAMVSLYKRDSSTPDGSTKTPEEENMEEIETLKAEIEKQKGEIERLTKALIEDGFVITAEEIAKRQEPEMIEVSGEMVAKSDIPAPVLKALEDAAEAQKKSELEKADYELAKRAKETLPNFSETVAKELVAKFGDTQEVMEALVAADKLFDTSMSEIGKSSAEGDLVKASDKLDEMVKAYMAENKLTKGEYAKAYAAVAKTAEGKKLITKTYKEE